MEYIIIGMSRGQHFEQYTQHKSTFDWELPQANILYHVTEIPIEIGTRMYEFTVVNSSIVHQELECMNLLW